MRVISDIYIQSGVVLFVFLFKRGVYVFLHAQSAGAQLLHAAHAGMRERIFEGVFHLLTTIAREYTRVPDPVEIFDTCKSPNIESYSDELPSRLERCWKEVCEWKYFTDVRELMLEANVTFTTDVVGQLCKVRNDVREKMHHCLPSNHRQTLDGAIRINENAVAADDGDTEDDGSFAEDGGGIADDVPGENEDGDMELDDPENEAEKDEEEDQSMASSSSVTTYNSSEFSDEDMYEFEQVEGNVKRYDIHMDNIIDASPSTLLEAIVGWEDFVCNWKHFFHKDSDAEKIVMDFENMLSYIIGLHTFDISVIAKLIGNDDTVAMREIEDIKRDISDSRVEMDMWLREECTDDNPVLLAEKKKFLQEEISERERLVEKHAGIVNKHYLDMRCVDHDNEKVVLSHPRPLREIAYGSVVFYDNMIEAIQKCTYHSTCLSCLGTNSTTCKSCDAHLRCTCAMRLCKHCVCVPVDVTEVFDDVFGMIPGVGTHGTSTQNDASSNSFDGYMYMEFLHECDKIIEILNSRESVPTMESLNKITGWFARMFRRQVDYRIQHIDVIGHWKQTERLWAVGGRRRYPNVDILKTLMQQNVMGDVSYKNIELECFTLLSHCFRLSIIAGKITNQASLNVMEKYTELYSLPFPARNIPGYMNDSIASKFERITDETQASLDQCELLPEDTTLFDFGWVADKQLYNDVSRSDVLRYLAIYQNVIRMLVARGLDASNMWDDDKSNYMYFKKLYSKVRENMSFKFTTMGRKVYVLFSAATSEEIYGIIEYFYWLAKGTDDMEMIVITKEKLIVDFFKQRSYEDVGKLTFFHDDELSYDMALTPYGKIRYRIVDDVNAAIATLGNNDIDEVDVQDYKQKLQAIKKSKDPVARFLGANVGDLVQILCHSKQFNTITSLRIVVP